MVEVTDEFGVCLAELVLDGQSQLAVRQLAAVMLKQVTSDWLIRMLTSDWLTVH